MTEGDALQIVQQAIWLTIVLAGPVVGSAMVIGVGVAFIQALTQIQEMTLTFVPKIIAGFLILLLTGSYSGNLLKVFTEQLYLRIALGFK
ncbi:MULTISPECIES: flagellar biosynthesis protein FliQ [Hyphomicrobium]|uniref:Flagellar biosynthetic protein FliQ n=1 Tax=Hyphomicrobium facile TaxID=51670 RepID=A0A1I7NRG9_9HYPH|nr:MULTISPECIES: flagellar biosynthesis protein FliQ [Hyphomicrobium]MBY0562022.1 flagellar biosynthesis protein FliQ [Hyphomicrobium sp.]CAA2142867.1 Flagellar biosynthetic protein FliQ [Hyphomicrobium sp. ghe19]SFV37200.1 flagellar biosynthetic protein FliQ [Hyphomicrobium facile]